MLFTFSPWQAIVSYLWDIFFLEIFGVSFANFSSKNVVSRIWQRSFVCDLISRKFTCSFARRLSLDVTLVLKEFMGIMIRREVGGENAKSM